MGEVPHGAPDLGDEALLGDVEAALVEDEVDGLHLLHLHPPGGQRQHHLVQHLRQVLLRLLQHLQAPGTGQGPGRGVLARPPQSSLWCPAHHAEVLDLVVQPAHGVRPAGLALRVGVRVAVEAGTDGRRRVGGCQGSPGAPPPRPPRGESAAVLLNKPLRGRTHGAGPLAHQSEILRIFCPICSPQ